jgi:hypothetical protein
MLQTPKNHVGYKLLNQKSATQPRSGLQQQDHHPEDANY